MARVTPHMGLRVWDQLNDKYDHTQQADNWARVDYHDHTPGRGVQIPTDGIEDGAITSSKLDVAVSVAAFIPTGMVIAYAGPSPLQTPGSLAPSGYVFADGALYDGTLALYADLWALIGTTYGGTGISSFAVPAFCKTNTVSSEGRFPLGVRTGIALGAQGGLQTVTLTAAQSGVNSNAAGSTDTQGSHSHTIHVGDANNTGVTSNYPGIPVIPNDRVNSLFAQFDQNQGTSSSGSHSHNVSLTARSADSSHENMPPYQTVNYIIKL